MKLLSVAIVSETRPLHTQIARHLHHFEDHEGVTFSICHYDSPEPLLSSPIHPDVAFLHIYGDGSPCDETAGIHSPPHQIAIDDLVFIESSRNYMTLHTRTEEIRVRLTMNHFETSLRKRGFFRTNRSQLVNLRNVRMIDRSRMVMLGDHSIPVGRSKRSPGRSTPRSTVEHTPNHTHSVV